MDLSITDLIPAALSHNRSKNSGVVSRQRDIWTDGQIQIIVWWFPPTSAVERLKSVLSVCLSMWLSTLSQLKGTSRGLEALQSQWQWQWQWQMFINCRIRSTYKTLATSFSMLHATWTILTINMCYDGNSQPLTHGHGGYMIRLELAIRNPGCPLNCLAYGKPWHDVLISLGQKYWWGGHIAGGCVKAQKVSF